MNLFMPANCWCAWTTVTSARRPITPKRCSGAHRDARKFARQIRFQQSTIRQASADLDAKAAQADFAKVDAERYHSPRPLQFRLPQDAERTSALDMQARASVSSAQAALAAAKQQLTVLNAEIAEAGGRRAGRGRSGDRSPQSRLYRNPLAD